MLRFIVHNVRERQELQHASGPLEFGRGPRRDGIVRVMIQDAYVSKDHVRIEEQSSGELRIENLSSKQPIVLSNGTIPPGGWSMLRPPLRLNVGDSYIDVELAIPEQVDHDSLRTVLQPLRVGGIAAGNRETLLNLGSAAPAPEQLTQWFEAVVAVQRSSPASPEYYDNTARAMVDLISLDSGLILLRHGDAWRVVARAFRDEGGPGREFSHTILERVVKDRRTFFQPKVGGLSDTDSLVNISSVVASPVFDAQDEVAGALYGSRIRKAGGREIGELEAKLVQVLASSVTAGLVRLEQDQRANQLRVAKDVAEAADRTKSQFLANMSHELRTPLNAIIGYSEMLIEEAAERTADDNVPDLEKIRGAGKHLLALINDILDLSKIEAGKMSLTLETFDLPKVIREVVSMVQPMVKKGVELKVNDSTRLASMHSDPTRLRQCLFNLLSNACKFTDKGSITLMAERKPHEGRDWVVFSVTDTGIGMNAEQQAKLFQDFQQVHATTRQAGGTGLGLSISRKLTRMMGGDIGARSEAGQGTTFTMWLPVAVEKAANFQDTGTVLPL